MISRSETSSPVTLETVAALSPGELAQLVPAERPVEEELGQQRGPVVPAQVPDRGALRWHDHPSPRNSMPQHPKYTP